MSHDKKKSKKGANDAHVSAKTIPDTAKGSTGNTGSGDAKTGVRNTIPDTKPDLKKASKSKR